MRRNIVAFRCGFSGFRWRRSKTAWGGKTVRRSLRSVVLGLLSALFAMVFVPFPLKMEANGNLCCRFEGRWVYAPVGGLS